MQSVLSSRTLLITGGTGSFGLRAVQEFLQHEPKRIVIYSRDPQKQDDMRVAFNDDRRLDFVIGDVRDRDRLTEAFAGVDYAVHAAAIKQVPACERHVGEAIHTNILGTMNVIAAAKANHVTRVLNLSADKAVYCSSVYGASKLLSERLFTAANAGSDCCFINLRYSNVLEGRGAVFETFRRKLSAGQEVFVFDPRMVRFFLTQGEVVQLCLFAFTQGVGGETIVKEALPMRIVDLANVMVRMIGKGTVRVLNNEARGGEKLDAVLLSKEESKRTYSYGDILIVNNLEVSLALPGLQRIPEKDYTVDEYEPMSPQDIETMVRRVLGEESIGLSVPV